MLLCFLVYNKEVKETKTQMRQPEFCVITVICVCRHYFLLDYFFVFLLSKYLRVTRMSKLIILTISVKISSTTFLLLHPWLWLPVKLVFLFSNNKKRC